MAGPWEKYQEAAPADGPWAKYADAPEAAEPSTRRSVRRLGTAAIPLIGPTLSALGIEFNPAGFAKGLPSGAADIGNTILTGMTKANEKAAEFLPDSIVEDRWKKKGALSGLVTGQPAQSEAGRANADREASLKQFITENASPSFDAGRLTANIAGTAGVGGALGGTVRAVAPRLAPLAESLASSGFRTGMAPTTTAGRLLNLGTRAAGGGITGAASAGLVNPEDAGAGGLVGALLPPAFQLVTKAGGAIASGARSAFAPQIAKDARSVVEAAGFKASELPAVRAALAQQGPSIVQAPATAPQILQNPGVSQLARTLRNAGDTKLLGAQQAQDAARLDALNRISPVTGTVQQSAENFGNALGPEVRAADEAARARTAAAFDAVDPFDETRFILPIGHMEAAQQRFLGRGTFNGGGNAQRAIDTARNIGEETIEAVAPARAGLTQDEQTLAQAVRRAGGINTSTPAGQAFAGELHDLRQTPGLRGIANNGRGQPLDTLAQRMHAEGFIPDSDPATLLNHLRDPDLAGGRGASADMDRLYQAAREALQGDAPGATTIARPVPFREVQNLRSSIGEAHADAVAKGRTREAAALDQMRRDIDAQVDAVAAGNGRPGENFPGDIVNQWREALAMHQDRMQRFRTGPQGSIFRQGGDGQPAAQGGELAPKFFSPRGSQADDMAAFGRVASPETTELLKNYAVTDAASQTNAAGALTNAKFNRWLAARSGAVNGLFDDGERATLGGVGRDLSRADNAERLGLATGSNTAQNVQNALSLGLLDNPMVNGIASRTPIIGRFTGPMLDALRQSAKRGRVDRLGTMLADPEELARAIAAYERLSVGRPLGLAGTSALTPLVFRSAPLLASGQ
ncbi:hypothetical protein [Variovorax sp. RA8]|uniref:hypothetical protein n=1 Tax=Variovorax sp. (strain JCM 16519 / RA8) TaxID=662548 RepID=UPI001316C148|nr:hypothetical protein [Variovorax sp. RA8]VTU34110.1 hypothetical protein RA8CHR_04906 [Variovorax sp. RA8]